MKAAGVSFPSGWRLASAHCTLHLGLLAARASQLLSVSGQVSKSKRTFPAGCERARPG
ncbi:protein of unknown function [Methylorubrum extorquens DM4]|uniref:Uncharacterized protein n=1 Tax=Methylorubrum extorquens (strain DSM 6343 / CIP 106787 / DM4) TaxID=661410 RepID=C7CFX6_METED|nr:protein of unknown function [Methylorubrum extorquens DM4]